MHALHLFSPADASLGRSALFDIALARVALIGIGLQDGSPSRKITRPMARMASVLVLLVLQGV